MSLSAGTRLGPYEILTPIGEGGMGQVWKARDTRLNRFVAIKTSHQRFSERFEREALAIAALNHPNICSLYDVAISPDGFSYLVMEYVEGRPIVSGETPGPLPLPQTLEYAGQILDALDAAHRKGIIHRDLKPGNIMVGPNGVKVLDFGLAKIEHAPTPAGATAAATQTMPLTGEGSVLGTLQYMSPEQIEGQEADARSDIFAFGLVFYELITGKRAFTGKSQASLIASILKEQHRPLQELQPLTPPGLESVLQTCLEKDPDKRWQSAREVKHALEWMTQYAAPAAGQIPAPPAKSSKLAWAVAALAVLLALGVAGWMLWSRTQPSAKTSRFEVTIPENVTFAQYVSVSPDGRKLAFNATGEKGGLWIRDLDALEWRQLPGTDNAVSPFWSPDSKFLAFGVQTQLKKIDVAGGPAQTLCEVPGTQVGSGAWNRDGVIIFGGRGRGSLWKVSQAGGVATQVTSVDTARGEAFHALPTFLPDEKHFLYLRNGPAERIGIYAGSLDAKPTEQPGGRILATSFAASYVNGYLFFMRDNTLMAEPFDSGKLQLTGEPAPVVEHVGTTGSIGVFSVSPSGTLAYRAGAGTGSYQLTWFDRKGAVLSTLGQVRPDEDIRFSPDGTRGVVRDAPTGGFGDLWTLDFARGVRTRFTFLQSTGSWGIWSPDGSRIAFAAGSVLDTIYEKAASGAGQEKELLKEPGKVHFPTSWSHDGRFLLYHVTNAPKTGDDLWVLPLQGDRKPTLLLGTEFNEFAASFSPDMRWVAYTSTESGRNEVYVRPFVASGPGGAPAFGEGKWQVSRDGGNQPKWRADGKEIIFQAPPNGTRKMAVDVKANGPALEIGIPQQLFLGPIDYGWDVTSDGNRFLMPVLPQGQQVAQVPITVVLNWPAQLKK